MTTRNEIIYWKRVSNLVDMIDKIDKKDETYREMWKGKLRDLSAKVRASVPFAQLIAYFEPQNLLKFFSNFSTSSPRIKSPFKNRLFIFFKIFLCKF